MGFIEKFTENLERFDWKRYEHYIHRDIYRELIQIVSDVESSELCGRVFIGKNPVNMQKVVEVFSLLECEHLQSVCEKYVKIEYPVKNTRAYLQAMLYNEVFEHSAKVDNEVGVNEGAGDV